MKRERWEFREKRDEYELKERRWAEMKRGLGWVKGKRTFFARTLIYFIAYI